MGYQTHTLDNGLRIIFLSSPSPVVYCGYEIKAGTRDEFPGKEGLAHFCEHLTFKGTRRRKAWNILNGLDSVGGDLNAYTTKEDTTFYAAVLKDDVPKAVDLLTDMVFHSTYPQQEIGKEVEVICDEIESYNDAPSDLIYDEFENLLFQGHPLGHAILGTAERVRSFRTADALQFTRTYYRPDNAIFFVYGDVDFQRLIRTLEKAFTTYPLPALTPPAPPSSSSSGTFGTLPLSPILVNKGTHQAHVMTGCRTYRFTHPKRMPLYLLNNLLGGPGMNARLNVSLRERHGLVYTVESSMTSYTDTGLWAIYFGCDAKDIPHCLRLIQKELDRLMAAPLTDNQLKAAKKQIKGQIGVACDNRENFALDFGKSFLHHDQEKDIASVFRQIDAITAEEIQAVACELFPQDHLTTLIFR